MPDPLAPIEPVLWKAAAVMVSPVPFPMPLIAAVLSSVPMVTIWP